MDFNEFDYLLAWYVIECCQETEGCQYRSFPHVGIQKDQSKSAGHDA